MREEKLIKHLLTSRIFAVNSFVIYSYGNVFDGNVMSSSEQFPKPYGSPGFKRFSLL